MAFETICDAPKSGGTCRSAACGSCADAIPGTASDPRCAFRFHVGLRQLRVHRLHGRGGRRGRHLAALCHRCRRQRSHPLRRGVLIPRSGRPLSAERLRLDHQDRPSFLWKRSRHADAGPAVRLHDSARDLCGDRRHVVMPGLTRASIPRCPRPLPRRSTPGRRSSPRSASSPNEACR